jgi:hypothetical protein
VRIGLGVCVCVCVRVCMCVCMSNGVQATCFTHKITATFADMDFYYNYSFIFLESTERFERIQTQLPNSKVCADRSNEIVRCLRS